MNGQPMDDARPTYRLGMCRGLSPAVVAAAGWLIWVGSGGCREDARLVEHKIPHVEVTTVRDQGVELGPEATPVEVAFVLLRAVRDDVLAGSNRQAREQALQRQMAVADPDFIFGRYRQIMGPRAVYERDEWVYKAVSRWAPAAAFYVDSFDFDLEAARSRLRVRPTSEREQWPGETVQVDLPVKHPGGVTGADVVVRVRLHKHEGGYWRVFHLGFAKTRGLSTTTRPAATTSQPTSLPAR